MIKLNKLAKEIVKNCLRSERVNQVSNHRAYLRQASVRMLELYGKSGDPSAILPERSDYEVLAAEVVCWMVAMLDKIGCDVEQLLREVIAYRTKHPDKAPKRS